MPLPIVLAIPSGLDSVTTSGMTRVWGGVGKEWGRGRSAAGVFVFVDFFVVPAEQQPVQQSDDAKEEEAEQDDQDDGREDLLGAEGFGAAGEVDAQAGVSAQPFADHGPHHAVGGGQLKSGEKGRQRGRDLQIAVGLPAVGAHGTQQAQLFLGNLFESVEEPQRHRKEAHHHHHEDLGRNAVAEPEYDQRRHGDHGHGLGNHQIGIEDLFEQLGAVHGHCRCHAQKRGQQEAGNAGEEGGAEVGPEQGRIGTEHPQHGPGRRQYPESDPQAGAEQLPERQQQQREEQRQPNAGGRFGHGLPVRRSSGSSITPKRSKTVCCTCLMRARTSAAVAPPRLTMKPQCLFETAAPPIWKPRRPQSSTSLPVKWPGGRLNTDPPLGRSIGCLSQRCFSSSAMRSAMAPGASGVRRNRLLRWIQPLVWKTLWR